MVYNETSFRLGSTRSVIREIFEYAKKRSAEIGGENVYDFSIGNPSVPAPESVKNTLMRIISETDPVQLHGYSSAQGDAVVREKIASYIRSAFNTEMTADNIYMTCGAAASLTISLRALLNPGDEVITFAPFFTEYRVFTEASGGVLKVVPPDEKDFSIDITAFEKLISPKTKAVIINSPNNPSGAVYSARTLESLCSILRQKSEEYGNPVFLISDEPYRELVYGGAEVPYITEYYDNSIVCYSFSKSLSLPGERIGYIAVSPKMKLCKEVYAAVCGAGRALGFVCAPVLFQRLVAECVGQTADISVYAENRDLLYNALKDYGYCCVKPSGAFYLFVKALEKDAKAFCEKAKKYELLLVPGDDFGCPGYVRIAYCVSTDMIKRALPSFKKLAQDYARD